MAYIDSMSAQAYIDKTREYLNYLEEHIEYTRKAFIEVSDACDGMQWVGDDYAWHTVRSEVMAHDLSKLGAEELVQYRDSFYPVDGQDELAATAGFNKAWEHHKKENHHHHETVEHYLDLVHMVIDWTAMGYKFGDTAQSYYEAQQDKMNFSPEQVEYLYQLFHRIKLFRS
jgi:hypothetical protein